MRRKTLEDGKSISKITQYYHTIRHTGCTFMWGKCNHCRWHLPSCQNTEGCRLRWNHRHEMLKALNRGLWLTLVCQVAWSCWRALRDWQTGVIIPIHKKEDRREYTNHRLSLPAKVYANCLGKNSAKYLNQCWVIPMRFSVAFQTKFSLHRKHSRNLRSMPKTATQVLSTAMGRRS